MTPMPNYSNSFHFDNINHDNNAFRLKMIKNQFFFRLQCCNLTESSKHLKQDMAHVRSYLHKSLKLVQINQKNQKTMLWKFTMHPRNTLHQPIVVHYHPRKHPLLQNNMKQILPPFCHPILHDGANFCK